MLTEFNHDLELVLDDDSGARNAISADHSDRSLSAQSSKIMLSVTRTWYDVVQYWQMRVLPKVK